MKKRILILVCFFCFIKIGTAQDAVIKDLEIKGNKKTKSSFIQKIIQVKSGMILDSLKLAKDVKQIKRLPSVANAYFTTTGSTFPNEYVVTYVIEENFTLIPTANIYTTNDNEFAYKVGVYEFNLLGENITFGGFYQHDIYSSYGVNLKAPYLFSKKTGLAANFQNLTTQEPVFLDQGVADYKYNNRTYEILGLYQFDLLNRIETGGNYFKETYRYKTGVTDAKVPQNFSVNKFMYKLVYEYNNLDFEYYFTSGFKSVLNFQYVRSTEDVLPDFVIGWNDFLYYKRIGYNGNWASRLRLGLASNIKTPFAPFSVDNNINLRGVGNIIDRGTGVVVLNTEYRHTLVEKDWFVLQGNVFVDSGSWRKAGGDFTDFSTSENIRVYPGIGLRLMHKRIFNAIFRIDYGYGVTPDATHGLVFGIGQYF